MASFFAILKELHHSLNIISTGDLAPWDMRSHGIQSWESGDFPILCKDCLGDDKNIRMIKEKYGWDCKVCLKPFTTFRWPLTFTKKGGSGRFRRTEICQSCCRLRNLCQSCLLDIKYSLPAQVRDKVLGEEVDVPEQEANRNYYIAHSAKRLERGDQTLIEYDKVDHSAQIVLESLAKKFKRADPADPLPCSFYAKGTCTRGTECPYKHALSAEKPPSLKTYQNRYYGKNDSKAEGMLKVLDNAETLGGGFLPPSDRTIHSLYVSGVRNPPITKEVLKSHFDALAPVKKVDIQFPDQTTALIAFCSRQAAECAASKSIGIIELENTRLQVCWTKSRLKGEKRPKEQIIKEIESEESDISIPLPPGCKDKSNYKTQNPSLYR